MRKKPGKWAVPRPFLKWVGGKGQLLDELLKRVAHAGEFERYHEPFVGGGALFFELARQKRLGRKQAFLSDNNANLIGAYRGIREDVEGVIARLEVHKAQHCKEYYYAVRAQVPEALLDRAARIIYLNKTCFNGLFRENSKGKFNVPMGRYKNPLICDADNLRACAAVLQKTKIEVRPFEAVVGKAQSGDLVYFDPPYVPVSKTASFTSYDKAGFGEESQRRLADVFRKLDAKGAYVLLSNSMTGLVKELYGDFTLKRVRANRRVNSRADRRGQIDEALVSNFMR
ncbi:MAG: Dam family site-specific DNA-(adenine-N6)-methyltransferase [Nitrospiraceae bacterium]|nr:Dam family site-specific DNA-(adenine-N6)-methyltransferase [Nitrospiraceae bacterium]